MYFPEAGTARIKAHASMPFICSDMVTVASLIIKAALTRKGSVGAHYRSDYKERGEGWQQHLGWNRNSFRFEQGEPLPTVKRRR